MATKIRLIGDGVTDDSAALQALIDDMVRFDETLSEMKNGFEDMISFGVGVMKYGNFGMHQADIAAIEDGKLWPMGDGLAEAIGAVQRIFMSGRGGGKSRCLKELGEIAEMQQRDLIAAVDDGHLTPGQKRHWDAMESKQTAREQLQRDAEAKALQERADSLAEAGRAMDRVQTGHDHRLGWNHG